MLYGYNISSKFASILSAKHNKLLIPHACVSNPSVLRVGIGCKQRIFGGPRTS